MITLFTSYALDMLGLASAVNLGLGLYAIGWLVLNILSQLNPNKAKFSYKFTRVEENCITYLLMELIKHVISPLDYFHRKANVIYGLIKRVKC